MKLYFTRGGAARLRAAGILLSALLSSLCPAMGATNAADVEWGGYNNGYTGERFSPLGEITPANVASLKPLCQMRLGDAGAFEAGLVMIGDTLYATTGHTTVALDPTNCAERWRHVYVPEQDELLAINRGVAFLDGRLFRGTADGRVIAIDAKTGRELWRVRAADPDQGEEFTAAPIAWNGLVFLGPAVGELGMRGHVFAFDAKTGRQVWRFDTVPVGNEPGADSWKIPATTKHGGGGTWTSYTLDPARGELFIPVGNPAPDFLPDSRPGENLYTDSVVVLDAKTGALKWYYQLEANDAHDWDLGAAPMLYTDAQGHQRVALGSKDGYVYVLDRDTHKLLFKTAVTTVGSQDKKPSPKGEHSCPGILGGVEWNGPAHSPQANAIYVGAVDWCWTVASAAPAPFDMKAVKSGAMYVGGTFVPDANASGWITAIDDRTGAVKWRYHSARPVVAGVTPTAGGVVFAGNLGGSFFAFDAASGKLLKEVPLKDALAGGVVTYRVGGKQYVAVTTGNISRISFGNGGSPAVAIMTTGLPADYAEKTLNVKRTEAGMNAGNGKMVFVQFCAACHGTNGASGYASGPDIRNVALDHKALVAWIKNPKAPMPKLFPEELTDKDVEAVATYVQSLGTVHGAAGTRAAPR
jgi:alcohol dehydrogenase (cytochrome c)